MDDVLALLDVPVRPSAYADVDLAWFTEVHRSLVDRLPDWVAAVQAPGGLTEDRSWRLLGWAEQGATLIARERRPDLVEAAAVALSLLEAGPLDRRDVMVVGAVVRRGAELAGLDFNTLVRIGCDRVPELGQRCLEWLWWVYDQVGSTHVEVGAGPTFRFERKKSDIDIEALERWAKGEE